MSDSRERQAEKCQKGGAPQFHLIPIRSAAAGFDEHWVKPVEPEKLKDLVARRTVGPR